MTRKTTGKEEGEVPSQADLFRSVGERLGIGGKKGEIYYVQRRADLDNLNSLWNAGQVY